MDKILCRVCGKEITSDVRALNLKMLNRRATTFLCLTCFAAYFKVSEKSLEEKIKQFKEMGCTLF